MMCSNRSHRIAEPWRCRSSGQANFKRCPYCKGTCCYAGSCFEDHLKKCNKKRECDAREKDLFGNEEDEDKNDDDDEHAKEGKQGKGHTPQSIFKLSSKTKTTTSSSSGKTNEGKVKAKLKRPKESCKPSAFQRSTKGHNLTEPSTQTNENVSSFQCCGDLCSIASMLFGSFKKKSRVICILPIIKRLKDKDLLKQLRAKSAEQKMQLFPTYRDITTAHVATFLWQTYDKAIALGVAGCLMKMDVTLAFDAICVDSLMETLADHDIDPTLVKLSMKGNVMNEPSVIDLPIYAPHKSIYANYIKDIRKILSVGTNLLLVASLLLLISSIVAMASPETLDIDPDEKFSMRQYVQWQRMRKLKNADLEELMELTAGVQARYEKNFKARKRRKTDPTGPFMTTFAHHEDLWDAVDRIEKHLENGEDGYALVLPPSGIQDW